MILGIDASNIRAGGGLTHLVELLKFANPEKQGFTQVIVWSNSSTLDKISNKMWIHKIHSPLLDKSFPYRVFWQIFKLKKQIQLMKCDVIFVPGGTDSSNFSPMVTMSQNMLPFEWNELRRFKFSILTLKLLALRYTQGRTFKNSDGIIFLTAHAKNAISSLLNKSKNRKKIIPHGIDARFFSPSKENQKVFSHSNPCKVIYVSIVDMYKHQWHVAEAVTQLRSSGIPITLDLVGPAYKPALNKLNQTLDVIDPKREFIFYRGSIPHAELHEIYKASDVNIFASSCENLPNILLEAMASGLPIACSNRGPMPEVLGDAGVYFDPENPNEIAAAIQMLIESPDLRLTKARVAYKRAQQFTWEKCSDDTFQFISEVAKNWKESHFHRN